MNPFRFLFSPLPYFGVFLFALSDPILAEPKLSLAAEPSSIYLHEPFQLVLQIQDLDSSDAAKANFETSSQATIEGPSIRSENRMWVTNGKRTQSVGQRWIYRVIPENAGRFVLSNATLTVGTKTYSCNDIVSVFVQGPEPSPYLSLTLSSSRNRVLVDEPFDVHLDISVRKLPSPFQNESPISIQAIPELQIPHLQDNPSESLHSQDITAVLNSLLAPRGTPGFGINGHTVSDDPFGGFMAFPSMHSSRAIFAPPREEGLLSGNPSWNYRITTQFSAESIGDITFRPSSFRGLLITGVRSDHTPITSQLFCESNPLVVHVVNPPEEGRPDTFAGTVGTDLQAQASIDAQSCRQGDPVKLTLDIQGSFSKRAFRLPPLGTRPGFRDVFRVYESDEDVHFEPIPNGLRYTWTLRPLQAGTLEVPSIAVGYFNPSSNAYLVAHSAPIPLRVEEVHAFNPDALFSDLESDDASSVRSQTLYPSAITVEESALQETPLLPSLRILLFLFGIPPFISFCIALLRHHHATYATRHQKRLRRRAPQRVVRLLRRAQTPQAAVSAVAQYFSDTFGLTVKAFTPSDAEMILRNESFSEDQIDSLLNLLQPLYEDSFTNPDSRPNRSQLDALSALLFALSKELRHD